MADFVRVLVKADVALRLPRDVAAGLVRQGLGEYETGTTEDSLPQTVTSALLSSEVPQTTEEVTDDG